MAKASNMAFRAEAVHLCLCKDSLEKLILITVARFRLSLYNQKNNQKYFPVLFSEYTAHGTLTCSVLLHKMQSKTWHSQIYEIEILLLFTYFKWMYLFNSYNTMTLLVVFVVVVVSLFWQWVHSLIHSQSKAQTS